MKSNAEIVEFIKGSMKFDIEFEKDPFKTERWKTFCFILNNNLEHDELISLFNELKQFAIEKGKMSNL